MDYEQEAIALYALPPAQFTTARDVRIAELKGEKRAALAGRLKLLRRPTVAAWCVNLLVGGYRAEVQALVDLGGELADAQRRGDAATIRVLSAEKRRRVTALVGVAARLAAQSVPPRAEVVGLEPGVVADLEATLNAAVADAAVARRVLSGRLVRGESYVGFGPLPEASSTGSSAAGSSSTGSSSTGFSSTGSSSTGRASGGRGGVGAEARADDPGERERAAVGAHVVAEQAVAVARAERDGARRRRDVARHAREEAAAVLAEAEQRLADAERTLAGSERTLERADQHRAETAARLDAITAGDEPSDRRTSRSAARST
ncbi:hypothetical protein [Cryptosporangium arvum]|uniref:hypothetical protein n=1 Tax=Cryptosporangium arvum TaxID=80871 RepID=UPI00055C197C|nr:hypothetical protein [Cryptosporangium arvum]